MNSLNQVFQPSKLRAMSAKSPLRKLVKHYHEPGDLHELTFSCYKRQPLLTNDAWRQLLARCIDAAGEECQMRLAAFVFMPEDMHLLIVQSRTLCEKSRWVAAERATHLTQLSVARKTGPTTCWASRTCRIICA